MTERTFQERAKLIKAMHTIMLAMNDERAYMAWIDVVPDCPYEEDFFYIAGDVELYDETCKLFRHILSTYGKSGFTVAEDLKAY